MLKQRLKIDHIPALVWNDTSSQVIIAIHGNMSNKEDIPIQMLAEAAEHKGYQVLSFDLPQHGERQTENMLCKVDTCVQELQLIMEYVKERWNTIDLFANSIGAYFSLLTFSHEPIRHAWFLSPIVDMQNIMENMMMWFHIDEEQLREEKEISTPIGQTLYWDYYCYVKTHPITNWPISCDILYGEHYFHFIQRKNLSYCLSFIHKLIKLISFSHCSTACSICFFAPLYLIKYSR